MTSLNKSSPIKANDLNQPQEMGLPPAQRGHGKKDIRMKGNKTGSDQFQDCQGFVIIVLIKSSIFKLCERKSKKRQEWPHFKYSSCYFH